MSNFPKRANLGTGHPLRVSLTVRNIQVSVAHRFGLSRSQNLAKRCNCCVFPLGVKKWIFRDIDQYSAHQHRLDDIGHAQDWLNGVAQSVVSGFFNYSSQYLGAGLLIIGKYLSDGS